MLIGSTRCVRVWARNAPTDLRRGFDGLAGLVEAEFRREVMSGDCFLFVNQRRTSAKVLLWDGTGLCVFAKRLAEGRFSRLWDGDPAAPLALTTTELALFLEGASLRGKLPLSPKEFSHKTH